MAYQQPYSSEFHISHAPAIKIMDTAGHGPVAGVVAHVHDGVGVYGSSFTSTDMSDESINEGDQTHHLPPASDL